MWARKGMSSVRKGVCFRRAGSEVSLIRGCLSRDMKTLRKKWGLVDMKGRAFLVGKRAMQKPCGGSLCSGWRRAKRPWAQFPLRACSVAQSCPTLCGPRDWSQPGPSVHGVSQARILEWVAISFSRASTPPEDQTRISCIGRWVLYHWATKEAHILLLLLLYTSVYFLNFTFKW